MKKSALIISVLFLTVGNIAISQVLEFDWFALSESSVPANHNTYIYHGEMDNQGNMIFHFNHHNYWPFEFCGHVFPVCNYFMTSLNDTFQIIKISSTGQYLWGIDIFEDDPIIECDSSNSIYVFCYDERYQVPFLFAGDTIYSFDSSYVSPAWHNVILKFDQNGIEKWASYISATMGMWGYGKGFLVGNNNDIIVDYSFLGDLYFNDSIISSGGSSTYHHALISIDNSNNLNWASHFQWANGGNTVGEVVSINNDGTINLFIFANSLDTLLMNNSIVYVTGSNVNRLYLRINKYGNLLSVKEITDDLFNLIQVNENGEIYSYKDFSSSFITYNTDTIFNPSNFNAMAIIKFDSNLNYLWSNCYGNIISSNPKDFVFDDQSNLYTYFRDETYIIHKGDTIMSNDGIILSFLNRNGYSIHTASFAENTGLVIRGVGNLQVSNTNKIMLAGHINYLQYDTIVLIGDTVFLPSYPVSTGGPFGSVLFGMHIKTPEYTKQQINFPQGWSLFSTYINPDSLDISNVLAPAADSLELVKDENGLVYWPSWGINLIGDIIKGKGYQAYANNSCSVQITGYEILPEITPLELYLGWSMLGYLRQSPGNIDAMLTTIAPQIIIVKDEFGDVYWPAYGINYIGDMLPGEGYLIKTISNTTLTYPAN